MERPEILVGDTSLDFGVGFCTTTSYGQAERWARLKMRRENKDIGYVAIYEFDYEAAKENTAIRRAGCIVSRNSKNGRHVSDSRKKEQNLH